MVYSPVYMPFRRHFRILGKPVLQRPAYHGILIDQAVRFRDYLAVMLLGTAPLEALWSSAACAISTMPA